MTKLYHLLIDSTYSLEEAWKALEEEGIEILYGSEEEGKVELFAHLTSTDFFSNLKWIKACEPYALPPIDWESQWAIHGHNFQEGYVNIDLSSLRKSTPSLRLKPGSGFGDLSHPTTRLMMQMLANYLKNQTVIDIGCGSGILTLASAAMGASNAFGIDIDLQAIEHSQQNALLNHLEKKSQFLTSANFKWYHQTDPALILMNMIRTEQQTAWNSLQCLHHQPAEIITSGIRSEERAIYLQQTANWGWILTKEEEEMEWLAFHFVTHLHKTTGVIA